MPQRLRSTKRVGLVVVMGVLTLTAVPAAGPPSPVDAGDPCPVGNTCGQLWLAPMGPGSGTITGGGAACTLDGDARIGVCTPEYSFAGSYLNLELTVTANPYSVLVSDDGDVIPAGHPTKLYAYILQGEKLHTKEVLFRLGIQELTIVVKGAGSGVVYHSDEGIHCPPDCTVSFPYGTTFGMNADPDPGSIFKSWSGVCAGQGDVCVLDMPKSTTVTVTFGLKPTATATPRPPTAAPTSAPTIAPTLAPSLVPSPSSASATLEPTASASTSPTPDATASPGSIPAATSAPTSGAGADGGFGSGLLIGLLIAGVVIGVGGFVMWRRRAPAV